jgi:hypothetical protein
MYIAGKSRYMECMLKSVYSLLLGNMAAILINSTFTSPQVLHHLEEGRAMGKSILSRTNQKRFHNMKGSPTDLNLQLQYKKVGI